jgi:hypothetical protein
VAALSLSALAPAQPFCPGARGTQTRPVTTRNHLTARSVLSLAEVMGALLGMAAITTRRWIP